MTKNDFIKFANENHVCYLATAENDQPRVRPLGFWFADDSGFYFQTGDMKPFYQQLKANPKTEVCFYHPEEMIGSMIRIAGEVEFLDDADLKVRVMQERPFLRGFGLSETSPDLIIFRIAHGEMYFWNMENNLKPKEILKF
ncbi:MAG: pyridoxamine 5'-phosphate oxidase family protein [bacterium]